MTPDELKKMDVQTVHEGYKKILANMLMDFYINAANDDVDLKTLKDLTDFIDTWISKRIKPQHKDWCPGDKGI